MRTDDTYLKNKSMDPEQAKLYRIREGADAFTFEEIKAQIDFSRAQEAYNQEAIEINNMMGELNLNHALDSFREFILYNLKLSGVLLNDPNRDIILYNKVKKLKIDNTGEDSFFFIPDPNRKSFLYRINFKDDKGLFHMVGTDTVEFWHPSKQYFELLD